MPAQVEIELAVRKPVRGLVREVNGQCGLAGSWRTVDHADPRWAAVRVGPFGRQDRTQLGEFPLPADESGHVVWQLGRDVARPQGAAMLLLCGQRVLEECRFAAQDLLVQSLQLGTGVDAELAREDLADGVVVPQGGGLLSGPVQRHHQLPGKRLVEW